MAIQSMRDNKQSVDARSKIILPDFAERQILSFLPALPHRLKAERVCKRWRKMSQQDVPYLDADLAICVRKNAAKKSVLKFLQRPNTALEKLTLPSALMLNESFIEAINLTQRLRRVRFHSITTKHLSQILAKNPELEKLEVLNASTLYLSGLRRVISIKRLKLKFIHFNGGYSLRNSCITTLANLCGENLTILRLTVATQVSSEIFLALAQYSHNLREITMRHCLRICVSHIQILLDGLWDKLQWIDFSACKGFSRLSSHHVMPSLRVVILDKTEANDDALFGIATIAPQLRVLSLQNCRNITDAGVCAIASPSGCQELDFIDLMSTSITERSIEALETFCPYLKVVRIESCRSIPREIRLKYTRKLWNRSITTDHLNDFEREFVSQRIGIVFGAQGVHESSSSEEEDSTDEDFYISSNKPSKKLKISVSKIVSSS